MKYTVFLAAVVFLVISIIVYVRNRPINNDASESKELTSYMVSSKLIDVGEVKQRSKIEARFTVYNTGSKQLLISKVAPDCHCTVADAEKAVVAPNDSAVIILRYDSTRLGPFQSSALITLNAKSSPALIVMRGNVIP